MQGILFNENNETIKIENKIESREIICPKRKKIY